jgi:hypothetical protein
MKYISIFRNLSVSHDTYINTQTSLQSNRCALKNTIKFSGSRDSRWLDKKCRWRTENKMIIFVTIIRVCWSHWSRGLWPRSTAARLLRSWVRIPPGVWMFVCCVCCVLSGRAFCDELITCPEESYQLWHVAVCDHKTSWYEEAIARAGLQSHRNKHYTSISYLLNTEWRSYHWQVRPFHCYATDKPIIGRTWFISSHVIK